VCSVKSLGRLHGPDHHAISAQKLQEGLLDIFTYPAELKLILISIPPFIRPSVGRYTTLASAHVKITRGDVEMSGNR
jgi:hypothetical protein